MRKTIFIIAVIICLAPLFLSAQEEEEIEDAKPRIAVMDLETTKGFLV